MVLITVREQARLARDHTRTREHTPAAPVAHYAATAAPPGALGTGMALLYLPSLRGNQPLVVVEGVGVADLKKGPGHLPVRVHAT